ncbi:MAG: NAD(P)H-dependent oxidoreductase subunit E [Hydrotalea sp.]|nr:NAD(P)H-dependent oxidoreductase subunit E [Hydrotalea sp.]
MSAKENNQPAKAFAHPGFKKQQRPFGMKGRPLDDSAYQEVLLLIENAKDLNPENNNQPRRDLLIEYLHLIQDKYNGIKQKHVKALAEVMKLAEAEVYEVATFYDHFDMLEDDETPPAITVRVCDSVVCMMAGARQLISDLEKIKPSGVRIKPSACMGHCDHAPVAQVGLSYAYDLKGKSGVEAIANKIKKGEVSADRLQPWPLAKFQAGEVKGYDLLKKIRADKKFGDEVLAMLGSANLRGLGGAGFPTAKKWQIVRDLAGKKLMAVNIDEGEPGTFKDYFYLANNPHQFISGMLMAAEIVGVEKIFIYLRGEYPDIRLLLQDALREAEPFFGDIKVELRRGAGAYICGEESAMLESIEGKRGLPRNRPPFVAQVGIFNRPTLVNNVETLYWVPEIVTRGAAWWSSFGANGRVGLRSFSLSGRVKNPGVKLAPAGITIKSLIDDYGGGMADGHEFKGYLPGGASGGILPATMADIPLDFDTLQPYGCFIGSAAVVVLSDKDNIADIAENLMAFFKHESCGQCTPCRVGTEKALTLMQGRQWHKDLLNELAQVMGDASICGLGQAASNPIKSAMAHFPNDFTAL